MSTSSSKDSKERSTSGVARKYIDDSDDDQPLPPKKRTSMKRKRIRSFSTDSDSMSNDKNSISGLGGADAAAPIAITNGNMHLVELDDETDYKRKLRPRSAAVKPASNTVPIHLEELDDYSSDERHRKPKRQKSITATGPSKKSGSSASMGKKPNTKTSPTITTPKNKSKAPSPKSVSVLTTPKSSKNKNSRNVPSTPNSTPRRKGIKDKSKKNSTTPNTTPKSGAKKNALNGVRTIDSYFAKKTIELSSSSDETEGAEEVEYATDSSSDIEVIACSKKSKASKKSTREIKKEKERLAEIERQQKLAFLYSGVPEVIKKAEKLYEKKKEEEDKFDNLGMFPVIAHSGYGCRSLVFVSCSPESNFGLLPNLHDSYFELPDSKISFNVPNQKETKELKSVILCCPNIDEIPQSLKQILPSKSKTPDTDDKQYLSMPWIEKYKIKRKKDLVVDKFALKKFERWLRQWKKDIDDDGGSSRKIIEKKRKTDSDSDFITDHSEDGELKKKSVILAGLPGTGKTAIVYTVAKHLGFKVVEVNFSERRSQRKVLQDVEEATLSRRLAEATTDDSRHCLLLFEDIDQIYEDEDEGFHSAVSQLISGSLRPIVMTIERVSAVIDPRIERKDPLWIPVALPSSKDIVHKLLLPLVQREISSQGECIDIDDMDYVIRLLESIASHSSFDIRKCINQTQALWSSSTFSMDSLHRGMQKLNLYLDHSIPNTNTSDAHENTLTEDTCSEKSKKQQIKDLEDTSKYLEMLGTFDMYSSHADSEIFSTIDSILTSSILADKNNQIDTFRNLTFDSDSTTTKYIESRDLCWTISQQYTEAEHDFKDYYDDVGYFRTIIKNTLINAQTVGITNGNGLGTGRSRRSGRLQHYFHPIDTELVSKISSTLEFQKELNVVKGLSNVKDS